MRRTGRPAGTHTRLVFPLNSGCLVDFLEYLAGIAVCSVSPDSRIVRESPPVSIHAETPPNVSDWPVGAKFSLSFQVHHLVYASCFSTSAEALGRMPWGIQGLFQDSPSKVFSFQKESLLKAPQSTQPKKPQRGGPVAQDQTSTQRAKPQGGRRARRPGAVVLPTQEASGRDAGQSLRTTKEQRRDRRPGPVVLPTQEASGREAGQTPRTSRPPNQRTARPVASGRATVRTVHYFHSTAQPQVSHWSGTGLMLWLVFGGWVGGGGRPVTTVKDGSLRTQAVNPKKGWKLQGQNP